MSEYWPGGNLTPEDGPNLSVNPIVRIGGGAARAASRIGGKPAMDVALHKLKRREFNGFAAIICDYIATRFRGWAEKFESLEKRLHL